MKAEKINPYAKAKAEAFGAYPESLINAAVAEGLQLAKIVRLNPNALSFEVYEHDIELLKHLAAKASVELKISSYLEPHRKLIKRRILLLPLAAVLMGMLLISSLFVWQIDIIGVQSLGRGELMRALEDGGLSVGCFWPGLKSDDIRSRVMLRIPEIAWMTVNISGSRAVVLINERMEKPEIYDESKAADLVASKTGLIRRVSVLSGKAEAEPGQAVTAGELLASGKLFNIMGQERTVRSRGSVMADTWYEIDAVCPEQLDIKTASGFSRHRFAMILGKRRINFYISSGKAIDECDKIIKEYNLGVDGHFALPIRFVHERIAYNEYSPGQGYDAEAMASRLEAVFAREVQGQILQSACTQSCTDGLYVMTLRAHCVENIAETRELAG